MTARVDGAEAATRLKAELERTLGDFDEQLNRGELPRALDFLERAHSLAPADPQVQSAHQRFEQAKAAREAAEARFRDEAGEGAVGASYSLADTLFLSF